MNELYYNIELRLLFLGVLFGFSLATIVYMSMDSVEKNLKRKIKARVKNAKLYKIKEL